MSGRYKTAHWIGAGALAAVCLVAVCWSLNRVPTAPVQRSASIAVNEAAVPLRTQHLPEVEVETVAVQEVAPVAQTATLAPPAVSAAPISREPKVVHQAVEAVAKDDEKTAPSPQRLNNPVLATAEPSGAQRPLVPTHRPQVQAQVQAQVSVEKSVPAPPIALPVPKVVSVQVAQVVTPPRVAETVIVKSRRTPVSTTIPVDSIGRGNSVTISLPSRGSR
jgi:hypothetical protein